MDTALMAMKRAAKAVLKDELKAARAERRKMGDAYLKGIQDRLTAQNEADGLRARLVKAEAEVAAYRNRANRAVSWAERNAIPHGNRMAHVLAQWVQQAGAGGQFVVNPFDRWDINPKP